MAQSTKGGRATPVKRGRKVRLIARPCTLHGSGFIGLGTPPVEADGPCVRFEVMKFADTQPHDLHT